MKKLYSRFWPDVRDLYQCAEGNPCIGKRQSEQGFMLVGLIVAIFVVLLVLSVAAPKMAQELRREREVEAVHRGNQYVRAIQLYYAKNHSYPGTMDALAKGTPVKYLRQQYIDPFTGKSDWKLIPVGEAKTTVKGFFGQPLPGLAPGLGSAAGMASPGGAAGAGAPGSGSAFGGSSGSSFGSSSGSSFGSSSSGSSGYGSSSSGSSGFGSTNASGTSLGSTAGSGTSTTGVATGGTESSAAGSTGSGSTGTGSTSTLGSAAGIASQSSGGFSSGGAPFVGVGIPKEGASIVVLNEQKSYNTWEFIYDPRIEQLKAAASLLGGGSQGLGSAAGMGSGVGAPGAGTSGFGSSGSSGFGSSSGSGFGSSSGSSFGSSSGSGFGSSSGSGFGSSPSSGSQGTGTPAPTTPQQPQ